MAEDSRAVAKDFVEIVLADFVANHARLVRFYLWDGIPVFRGRVGRQD